MDIDTSSTVTPKEKKDKVYIHVMLLFATVAIVCTNQINYGLLQRFLYIGNFKLIYHEPWHHIK